MVTCREHHSDHHLAFLGSYVVRIISKLPSITFLNLHVRYVPSMLANVTFWPPLLCRVHCFYRDSNTILKSRIANHLMVFSRLQDTGSRDIGRQEYARLAGSKSGAPFEA
jgi:hypothetical protein